jgi:hypothetical protein
VGRQPGDKGDNTIVVAEKRSSTGRKIGFIIGMSLLLGCMAGAIFLGVHADEATNKQWLEVTMLAMAYHLIVHELFVALGQLILLLYCKHVRGCLLPLCQTLLNADVAAEFEDCLFSFPSQSIAP